MRDEPALDAAALFLKDDPEGLRQLFASIDLLAECPRPEGSIPHGSPDLRRIHSGRYRARYEISDTTVTVVVIHVGRAARPGTRGPAAGPATSPGSCGPAGGTGRPAGPRSPRPRRPPPGSRRPDCGW
ncbi:type II toxin-antitoxin system RelE/ParE family toxin [Streptomyces sp. NPDC004296]|uniref:type II toxin-antitoxin system RelE family toxin n=1 Tax=Streptomyces sp. NPDC004296 TaxID=3364697 RepID=UPI0036C81382